MPATVWENIRIFLCVFMTFRTVSLPGLKVSSVTDGVMNILGRSPVQQIIDPVVIMNIIPVTHLLPLRAGPQESFGN